MSARGHPDPEELPDLATWYLTTNLPAAVSCRPKTPWR
jgi:hypothetical protein